jgi:hypothetical protein
MTITVKDTAITDADGVIYSKTLTIDNGGGLPIENYDLTGNVTLEPYQKSSLVQDGNSGKIYIDPETAWDLGNLLEVTDRYYDGFRFFIISINDTIDFGGYIAEGGSPDDYLTLENMFRRARAMSRGTVKKYNDLKARAKYKTHAGRRVTSNLAECFERAKQEESIRQAIRTLKTSL